MSWGGYCEIEWAVDVELRTAGGSDVWLHTMSAQDRLQGREQRIKTSVASRCIWRGTFAETLGGCHGQCRHRRRTTVPAGRQRQQQPRSDNVRASGVGFGGLLGNAKTSEAMGGARLRVETSFEKTRDSIGRSTASLGFRREYVGYACNRYILAPCFAGRSELSGWSCQ